MSTVQLKESDLSTDAGTSKPVEYFQLVYETLHLAAQRVGGFMDRTYAIGGYTMRLRFAGPALVPSITTAFDHLAQDDASTPDLTIGVWDSASTGTRMLPPPWPRDDFVVARGEILGYNNKRIYTAFQHGSNAVNMLDLERDLAIFWVPTASEIPYWEKGSPLKTILHWWLLNHERQLVHGAAVGNSLGGVLIAGKGGSGKSTTALACLNSELRYAGDDYTLLALEPTPIVYSLYNSAKLDSEHIKCFPQLLPKISNRDRLGEEKALFFVNQHYPSRIARRLNVRAILLPRVTGVPETRLRKASTAMGLAALAPSTIFQLPRAGQEAFKFLAAFVREVPCYNLKLGTDIARIPAVIEELLSEM
jgi:hypothetical protein